MNKALILGQAFITAYLARLIKDSAGRLETSFTLTGATTLQILYIKPDGTSGAWDGSISDSTKVAYTTLAGDLNLPGKYSFQAKVINAAGTWYGKVVTEEVKPNLD